MKKDLNIKAATNIQCTGCHGDIRRGEKLHLFSLRNALVRAVLAGKPETLGRWCVACVGKHNRTAA